MAVIAPVLAAVLGVSWLTTSGCGGDCSCSVADRPTALKTYQPALGTIVPERLIGYSRRKRVASLRDVVLLVDQSGSMASSVVYSGELAASLASLRAVTTRLVVFDTSAVDLTEQLSDPVELLFSTQLGGGTDIDRAVAYGQSLVRRPADTIVVLISGLLEGGDRSALVRRLGSPRRQRRHAGGLLALSDVGAWASRQGLVVGR